MDDDAFDVPVRGDGIRLGQFLKLANLIESGAEAKEVISDGLVTVNGDCLLYTSPSPRDRTRSRMPSSA